MPSSSTILPSTAAPKLVTRLPHRLEPFLDANGRRMQGWTVAEFPTAGDAAAFFSSNGDAAMPCWKRLAVVNGLLVEVR